MATENNENYTQLQTMLPNEHLRADASSGVNKEKLASYQLYTDRKNDSYPKNNNL